MLSWRLLFSLLAFSWLLQGTDFPWHRLCYLEEIWYLLGDMAIEQLCYWVATNTAGKKLIRFIIKKGIVLTLNWLCSTRTLSLCEEYQMSGDLWLIIILRITKHDRSI
jgi:hypothetical protein